MISRFRSEVNVENEKQLTEERIREIVREELLKEQEFKSKIVRQFEESLLEGSPVERPPIQIIKGHDDLIEAVLSVKIC